MTFGDTIKWKLEKAWSGLSCLLSSQCPKVHGESGELGTVVLLAHALMSNALILLRSSYASWSLPCIFSASLLILSNSGKRGQTVTELW